MKTFLVLCFIICVNMVVCCKKPDTCCSTLSTRFDTISEKLDEVLEKVSACSTPEPACTEQEVVNPSFEESGGWTIGTVPTFTSIAAFEGNRSVASCQVPLGQQFQFAAGVRTVITSVYVKVDENTGRIPTLECAFEDGLGGDYRGKEYVETVGNWRRIDIEVMSTQDLTNGLCTMVNACSGPSGQPVAFFDVFRMFTLTETQDVAACREMFLPDSVARK